MQTQVAARGYVIDVSGDTGQILMPLDREALSRALRNLLDNAVKYSPGSPRIDVILAREDGHVSVAVRDRGIGIPLGEQRAIFDRFVRGAESKTRRIHGTGIGLAMVRQIVLAHGGEILVESAPGEGSMFTMRWPTVAPGHRSPRMAHRPDVL